MFSIIFSQIGEKLSQTHSNLHEFLIIYSWMYTIFLHTLHYYYKLIIKSLSFTFLLSINLFPMV